MLILIPVPVTFEWNSVYSENRFIFNQKINRFSEQKLTVFRNKPSFFRVIFIQKLPALGHRNAQYIPLVRFPIFPLKISSNFDITPSPRKNEVWPPTSSTSCSVGEQTSLMTGSTENIWANLSEPKERITLQCTNNNVRHMKNAVVGVVITLNDIICKPCHHSWLGWGNNWVVLTM